MGFIATGLFIAWLSAIIIGAYLITPKRIRIKLNEIIESIGG